MNTIKFLGEQVKVNHWINGITEEEVKGAFFKGLKNMGYREKDIINNLESVSLKSDVYSGERYISAFFYNHERDDFQMIVRHETDYRGGGYRAGDIVG